MHGWQWAHLETTLVIGYPTALLGLVGLVAGSFTSTERAKLDSGASAAELTLVNMKRCSLLQKYIHQN